MHNRKVIHCKEYQQIWTMEDIQFYLQEPLFVEKSWIDTWLPTIALVSLFFLAKTCATPFTCCPILFNTPNVPLRLQNVHFQKNLSAILAPKNTTFKTKVWRHDVKCNKTRKTIWKEKIVFMKQLMNLPSTTYLNT